MYCSRKCATAREEGDDDDDDDNGDARETRSRLRALGARVARSEEESHQNELRAAHFGAPQFVRTFLGILPPFRPLFSFGQEETRIVHIAWFRTVDILKTS